MKTIPFHRAFVVWGKSLIVPVPTFLVLGWICSAWLLGANAFADTPTDTVTETPTEVFTETSTPTFSETPTATPSVSMSPTETCTLTVSETATLTSTPNTPLVTVTPSPVINFTPAFTPSSTSTPRPPTTGEELGEVETPFATFIPGSSSRPMWQLYFISGGATSDVKCQIFDVHGRQMVTLIPRSQGNRWLVEWDGKSGSMTCPSGVYVYILRSKRAIKQGVLVLAR